MSKDENPHRIILVFIKDTSYKGTYNSNPFNFQRTFKAPKASATASSNVEQEAGPSTRSRRSLFSWTAVSTPQSEASDVGENDSTIEEVTVCLNGHSLTSLCMPVEKASASNSFIRFYLNCGFFNGLFSNSVTMEGYLGGYYFDITDLSSGMNASCQFLDPAVRQGMKNSIPAAIAVLQLQFKFN